MTKEELEQGMRDMDRALLPHTKDGYIDPMHFFGGSAEQLYYPIPKRTEENDGPPMYFAEDFVGGKIPDYLTYEPGHEKPGAITYLDSIVYDNPLLNLSYPQWRQVTGATKLKKLEPCQVQIQVKSERTYTDSPALPLGYEEDGFRLEPRSDGLFLFDDNGQTRFSNFTLAIRECRYLHERGKPAAQELQLEVQCGGRTHTMIVSCQELDNIGRILQQKVPNAIISVSLAKTSALLTNYVRSMIEYAPIKHVYRHTGFECINGQWIYVHDSAAPPSSDVELRTGFHIGCDPHTGPKLAFRNAMGILQLSLKESLMVPLMLEAHLAPLVQLFDQAGHVPRFVVFLNGTTGSLKTSISMCIYRLFQQQKESPEANFTDTETALEVKLASTHSRVLVVDDFQPPVTASAGKTKLERLEMIIRFVGDRIGKARSNCELGLVEQCPPSCCCVVTGEDTGGSHSSLLRCLVLRLRKGDIDGPRLKRFQDDPLLLQTHFYHFLAWCGRHGESIIRMIRDEFEVQRQFFSQVAKEPRLIDTGATLHITANILLQYGAEIGAVPDSEQVYDQWTRALYTALQLSEEYSHSMDPLAMYLQALFDLNQSGKLAVAPCEEAYVPEKFFGYKAGDYWWLHARTIFPHIVRYWNEFGVRFPLSVGKIIELLAHHGLIEMDHETRNSKVKILYSKRSSLPGRPRMLVLNAPAAKIYLEKHVSEI